jgi:hypothetical protein
VTKSRKMSWAGPVARVGKVKVLSPLEHASSRPYNTFLTHVPLISL